jgi:hypothetical protein
MLALRAVAQFLFSALKPLPTAMNTAVNISSSVAGLTLLSLFGAKAGAGDARNASRFEFWPWGAFALLVGITILIAIAGVRLEMRRLRAEQVSLTVQALEPEGFGPRGFSRNQDEWTQHLSIENLGPGGQFRATLATNIQGIRAPYGKGVASAWEQSRGKDVSLSHGETGTLRLTSSYVSLKGNTVVRLWIPPSPHSGDAYGVGNEQIVDSHEISFELSVTDTGRDVSRKRRIAITFAPDGKPSATVRELSDAGRR